MEWRVRKDSKILHMTKLGGEKWNEGNTRNRAFSSLMKSGNKAVWKRQSHKTFVSKK